MGAWPGEEFVAGEGLAHGTGTGEGHPRRECVRLPWARMLTLSAPELLVMEEAGGLRGAQASLGR